MSTSYNRRGVLAALAATAAWPLAAGAQTKVRRIGVLVAYAESAVLGQDLVAVFRDGLRKLGWIEGQNVRIDYRWPGAEAERMQRAVKDMVALEPEVILTASSSMVALLQRETRTIPIVFANLVDPVGQGFVTSLSKPGGNITGFVNFDTSMAGKWVELLKEIAPRVGRVSVPYHSITQPYYASYLPIFAKAGASLGLTVHPAPIRNLDDLEKLVADTAREANSAIIPVPGGFTTARTAEIASIVNRYRLPSVYNIRGYADAGGLLSYGNDLHDNFRRAASYVDRILKGETPADLPVQFPVKFELVINLKTAKALGLEVPWFLQQRADAIIE